MLFRREGKTDKRSKVWTLSRKLLSSGLFLVILTMGLTGAMVLRLNLRLQIQRVEMELQDLSEMAASNPLVIQALKSDSNSPEMVEYLDNLVTGIRGVDVISVVNMSMRRLYHPMHHLIGLDAVNVETARALKGERYYTEALGPLGEQFRYFVPVIDPDTKEQIGFIISAVFKTGIKSQEKAIYEMHLKIFIPILLIVMMVTWLMEHSIKKSLLGFDPVQISRVFLERGEVLNSLEEGVVAVDVEGHISVANKAARDMLKITDADIGSALLDELYPQIRIGEVMEQGTPLYSSGLTYGDINIICDRIPVKDEGRLVGAVAILRNRTEFTRMAEELTGVNHMNDALRSNTHEFMNKLHVILGLMRIGAQEEAERYITGISREQSDVIGPVLKKIQNKTLGALILGKISHCRELDISFELDPSSFVPVSSAFLSGNSFVTLVGNLVENAIEAVNAKKKGDGERMVSLLVHEDERSLMISVDDTGEGMTPEEIERVRQGGFSTKGRHRGTGMRLIHSVLELNDGEMQIDSEKGNGTTITVSFTRRTNS